MSIELKVQVRPLEMNDLDPVAHIHSAAFPQSALTMLGNETVWRYYEWLLTGPHDAVAFGATLSGEVVGFCFGGIYRGATSGFLKKNRNFLALRVLTHPWLTVNPLFRQRLRSGTNILRRLAQPSKRGWDGTLPPAKTKSFGILSVAVHPQRQGLRIGDLLMKASEAEACGRGFREMNLSVHVSNHQAIRFYEAQGWERWPQTGVWCGEMRKVITD